MKKVISVFLVGVLMAATMSGCSKEQNKVNEKKEESSVVQTTANEKNNQEEFTLKISLQNPESDGLLIAEEIFKKKYPKATIEYITSPWGNGGQDLRYKQLVLISGGQVPDIGKMVWGKEFFKNGIIADITSEVKSWDTYKRLSDGQLQRMTYDDKIFGITYNNNCVYQFVNMDILKKAGFSEPPKTMEELKSLAKTIKDMNLKTEDGKEIYTVSFEGGNWTTDWWLWANGGQQMNKDYTKTLINSPESLEAFKEMQEYVKNGWAPKADGSYDQLWLNGQIAIWTCGDWNIGATKDAGINVKYAPLPKGKAGNDTSIGGVEWAVFNSSKHKKEALEFLKILYSEEFQTTFDNGITDIAMYDNEINQNKWKKIEKLEAKLVQKSQLENTKYNFLEAPYTFTEGAKIYNEALAKILVGVEDVETVMNEAAAKINKGMEKELEN